MTLSSSRFKEEAREVSDKEAAKTHTHLRPARNSEVVARDRTRKPFRRSQESSLCRGFLPIAALSVQSKVHHAIPGKATLGHSSIKLHTTWQVVHDSTKTIYWQELHNVVCPIMRGHYTDRGANRRTPLTKKDGILGP